MPELETISWTVRLRVTMPTPFNICEINEQILRSVEAVLAKIAAENVGCGIEGEEEKR